MVRRRKLTVVTEDGRTYEILASYSEAHWGWEATVLDAKRQSRVELAEGPFLGATPYCCIGQAAERLAEAADRGKLSP